VKTESFKGALLSTLMIVSIIALAIPLLFSPRPVHATLTPHAPIYIDGNLGFTKPDPVNGGGSGTENDPYIIENWDINASSANGIEIRNTTAYFIIRNCYVHDEKSYWKEGIYLYNVTNGRIENNTAENNWFGIYLDYSNNNVVENSTARNNLGGIFLWDSDNNLISSIVSENNPLFEGYASAGIILANSSNNTLTNNACDNNFFGIYDSSSSNNTLDNNTCNHNFRGIHLDDSNNETLINNILSNNRYNFGVWGSSISHFVHDIDTSNLVDGKPIRYLVGCSGEVVDSSLEVGYLGLVNCDNIRVENLALENNIEGILLAFTDNSHVDNCTLGNNETGVFLNNSDNNVIKNCTVSGNIDEGIYLLDDSDNNALTNNTCENNELYGIAIWDSDNNIISGNTLKNNWTGIYLGPSSNNQIYHNNLINNNNQVYDDGTNKWDGGYPSGGNYWSNYTGVDENHGENQDIPGSDGIGDTPYYIPGGSNLDRYPLMRPWAVKSKAEIRTVIYPAADVYAFSGDGTRYSRTQLKFDISNVPSGSKILSAKLWLYRFAADNWDGEVLLNRVDDQLWGEKITAIEFDAQTLTNEETQASKFMSPGWDYLDVEDQLNADHGAGHAYSSYRLRWANDDGSEQSVGIDDARFLVIESELDELCIIFLSSEYNGSDPYLEVVYVPPYAVSVSISPTYRSGAPGEELSYAVMVANTGNLDDNYALTVSDNTGWGPTLGDNLLEVPAGEDRQTTLSVIIPAGAENCTRDNITVTVISQADNTVRDNASCIAHAVRVGFIPRGPIYINGDDNFIPANGVTSGSGTENDPYIIENWDISAENAHGIWIENTTAHFIVRNCYVHDGWNNGKYGIYLDPVINGIIDNNIVENNGTGIYLEYSDNNIISNNIVRKNLYNGIRLDYSNNNIIENNLAENNGDDGIELVGSNNNSILNNLTKNNVCNGIVLSGSCNNSLISSNTMENNYYGIRIFNSDNCLISSNTVENNGDYGICLDSSDNSTISGNTIGNNSSDGIYLSGSDNNLISNNVVKNGYNPSIELEYSDNNLLFNNTVENNHGDGIRLHYSDNNFLSNNTLKNNFYDGIDISGSNNIVSNNIMENNTNGIRLYGSSNLLSNNICSNNNNYGIRLEGLNNTLDNNVCSNNFLFGIRLESSSNNTLSNNIVKNNYCAGIGLWNSDNATISNNIVENNSDYGIHLFGVDNNGSDNNHIENNIVENNGTGIYLEYSDYNLISNDIVRKNLYNGIRLDYSHNNIIENNLVENNALGIQLYSSHNNPISNNLVENNIEGIRLDCSNNNLISNNLAENNSGGIILGNYSDNNLVSNNIVENNDGYGISLTYYTSNNTLSNNICSNNFGGIFLDRSENCVILNNTVENNYYGINLGHSDNNLISGNTVENNYYDDIHLLGSDNNLLSNNTVVGNNYTYGIYLDDSSINTIEKNLLENNLHGIYLWYSLVNTICNNTVENNTYGIQLSYYSDNNHIYHNNILNNATQAYDECSNFWDNGYPSGGNYWSDYTGSDNYWGENQDIPGSDGIGDVPYHIPGDNNQDRYPLMEPWMPRVPGVIVRGKDTAYNVNLAGNPPLKLYTSSPPLMIAARVGSGAVVAAGTVSTCRDNMWNNPANPTPYFDVLLDKAFQWMMPGAKEVLWYEGYGVYNTIDTPEVRCQQLEDALEAKGYTLTGDATMPITSGLLSGYDILVIPQLQLGDMGTGGDPALLPDADVQAIVDFVRGGGGLLIMDSSDYGGQNYCKVQNKILKALDAGFYLQDDQVQDDTNRWGGASYQPIAVIDTTTAIGSSYQAATGKDEIGLYSICSLRIEKDYDVSVEVSPFANLGEAGDNLLYEAMITNIGRNADNYIITVMDNLAWPISISENEISLLPSEDTIIVVRVTVPENLMEKSADWVTLRASGVSGAEDSADFRAISVVPLEKPPYPIAHPETLRFLGPGLPTLLVDLPAVPIITAIETGYSNDLTPREPWPMLYGKGEFAPVGAAALVDNGRVITTANSILRDRYFDRAELANDEVMSLIARWMINWDDPRGHEFLYYCTDPALGTYHVPSIVSKWLNMVENECGFELGVQVGGEITPELLDNYDVLQLAELMRPFSPDEIQAVVNWVKGGGGLIIMCSADYGGYSRPNYPNEILEALDCPIRFQDDELYDDDSWVIDGPWFPQVYLLDPREVNPEFDVWFPPPPPPPVIEWDALITATFSGGSDDAIFGVRADATPGFDSGCDIPEPPAPPEPPYVRAYFYYPEQIPEELHRSCLAPENFMEWPLRIEYADDIEDITLTWSVENVPAEYNVLLYRGGASVADMRAEDNYTFEAASDNHDFRVIVGKLVPFTLELTQGWNMISFPILLENMSPDAIFGGYYVLYRWDAENKRYVLHADSGSFIEPDSDVEVGVGYWVYVLEDENLDLLGFPVERLILSLRQGWNLIGSSYGGSSIADPADDPDDSVLPWAFTWNTREKRYDMTQLLEAGKGYWVYALRNCTLTLPAPKVTTPPSAMISVSAEKSAPNTVKLTISHVGGDDLVINDLQIKATNDNVGGMVTIDNPDLGVGATFTVGESGSIEYEYIGVETGDVLTVYIIHKPSKQKIFSSSSIVVQAGYPAIGMNVEAYGDNEIIIRVLSGSIEAGEWAYSVSATEGAYNWVTGTEALDAPSVSLGTYAHGTWYVNVKHIASGHVYFTPDQVVTLPAP